MEDQEEINFRPYIAAVARRWIWIILSAMLAAAITAFALSFVPKTYTATSSVIVLIRQTGSQLGVDAPIMSVETIDAAARRQGLLSLAESEAIEAKLPSEILARMSPRNYQPGMFIQQGLIDVQGDGDLLTIRAHAESPAKAKQLADSWATTYVEYVKTLYTDEHSQVELAGTALMPFRPSSPKITQLAALGGFGGALLAIVVVLLGEIVGPQVAPKWFHRSPKKRAIDYPSPSS